MDLSLTASAGALRVKSSREEDLARCGGLFPKWAGRLACEQLCDFETELLYTIPDLVAIETEQLCSLALIPVTAFERLHQ